MLGFDTSMSPAVASPLRRPQRALGGGPARQWAAAGSHPVHRRRLDVQGLRGLAVLLVVCFHAGLPVRGGFLGVDVFFVVSGFVITTTLLSELELTGRLDVGAFYARRIRRLLPALATMLVVVTAAGVLADPAAAVRSASLTGIFASAFSSNVYLARLPTGYFAPSAALNPLLHTWTLGVEEQFYVGFPLLLAGLWWARTRLGIRGRAAGVGGGILGIAALSLLLAWLLPATQAFYLAPTRAWELAVGALAALGGSALATGSKRVSLGAGWVALGAILFAALSAHHHTGVPRVALLPAVATGLLLALGTGARSGATRVLGDRRLVWIGDLSYSLYLWHWPLIVFATAALPDRGWAAPGAAALSLLPAWVSLRLIENPIRYGKRFRSRRAVGLAAACVCVPLATCGAALAVTRWIDANPSMTSWHASQRLHADVTRGCDEPTPLGLRDRAPCIWRVTHSAGTIVLFGDSNAGQFTEPVTAAGNRAGYDVEVATFSSCPFVGIRVRWTDRLEDPACARFGLQTVDYLTRVKPSLVIVASRTDLYVDNPASALAEAPRDRFSKGLREKQELWLAALRRTLDALNGAGIPVILVHEIPRLPAAPDDCAVFRILLHDCAPAVGLQAAESELAPSARIESLAVAGASDSSTLTFLHELCGARTCGSVRGSTVRYRDTEHLSVEGARALTGAFYRAIEARARHA